MIRLKRAKIQLRKVTKIDRRLYVEGERGGGGWGGGASLRPATTIQTSVKFRDIEELYLRGDEWSMKIFNCSQNFTFARFARKI